MARRSSARLRNRNSSTPQRVSLAHDVITRTPRTAPVKLQALREYEGMPGAFPGSASPPTLDVNKQITAVPVKFDTSTPTNTTPIKPTDEEMHPKQHQQSTAKPLDEARWLGFSNMAPHTEPPKQTSKLAILQGTPTKAPTAAALDSPKVRFTFTREQSLELSPAAKKFMDEKREEALKIREQMVADGEGPQEPHDIRGRKIATPKGKKSRFSQAHLDQFQKMDSIAGHASAFRADPNRPKAAAPASVQSHVAGQQAPKSLKRSPSKAGLDESDHTQAAIVRGNSQVTTATRLPETQASKYSRSPSSQETATPAKRMKRANADDVSTPQSTAWTTNNAKPSTVSSPKLLAKKQDFASNATIDSPTHASLARATSVKLVKVTKIPAPGLTRSPSKINTKERNNGGPEPSTPLLARSPSKVSLNRDRTVERPKPLMSPLLMRSPLRGSPFKGAPEVVDKEEQKPKKTPLLSRTPLKTSVIKITDPEVASPKPSTSTPFLARSPSKIAMPKEQATHAAERNPGESSGKSLMGRFNLLRSSPMKSILRSPQRLYSNDPAKVAAGTHFASPSNLTGNNNATMSPSPKAVEKHVDFSSSTKARYEREQSESSSTPTKASMQSTKPDASIQNNPSATLVTYPTLPCDDAGPTCTPQKRRQTAAPGDFTFMTHGHGIIFGQSPNAPASIANSKFPSTIRHVSAEPQLALPAAPATGSKKRKFDFENDKAVDEEIAGHASDKENAEVEDEGRPAKRAKTQDSAPSPTKAITRPPTIGVKPKKSAKGGKEKKPTTISMARLNALAQPKRKA